MKTDILKQQLKFIEEETLKIKSKHKTIRTREDLDTINELDAILVQLNVILKNLPWFFFFRKLYNFLYGEIYIIFKGDLKNGRKWENEWK